MSRAAVTVPAQANAIPPGYPVTAYTDSIALPLPEIRPLAGEIRADVCVVGGGYAGVSAALALARAGRKVVLLEAERIGWAASGRNGGQLVSGFAHEPATLRAVLGDEIACALWRCAEEAKASVHRHIAAHAIPCDFKPGYAFAATKSRHLRMLRAAMEDLQQRYGYTRLEWVEPERSRQRIADSVRYRGGVLDHGSGHLHPLNYCLGLAAAARAAGATLYERSRVLTLDPGDGVRAARLRTAAGEVVADQVLLCGNALISGIAPSIEGRIMPCATYILATAPLDDATARRLIPGDIAVGDANFVLDYFRLDSRRRLLFGGQVSYSLRQPDDLVPGMRRLLARAFPELADSPVEGAWGGLVDITLNRLPDLGRVAPRVYYAQGFSGHGLALAGFCGEVLAAATMGEAERFDLFGRIRHHPFPGGRRFRRPLLVLAMTWARLMDAL